MATYLSNLDTWCTFTRKMKNTQTIFVLGDPVSVDSLDVSGHGVTNEMIEMYNSAALNYFKKSCKEVFVWSSARSLVDKLVLENYEYFMKDALHMSGSVYKLQLQLLLNYILNAVCQR